MRILINRISRNVALDGRPHLRTSALLGRWGIPPRVTFHWPNINRISWNVALNGRPHLRTSALLNRGGIPSRATFLDSYDQTSSLHSLTRTSIIVFTHPRTTSCPQIGPPTQHIYRYILLGLSHLQIVKVLFIEELVVILWLTIHYRAFIIFS